MANNLFYKTGSTSIRVQCVLLGCRVLSHSELGCFLILSSKATMKACLAPSVKIVK